MYQYDQETTLTPTGDQQYAGHVHASWNIGDNPNGGYLASLAVAALRQMSPQHPDPLSLTIHYLRPGSGDTDCQVNGQLLRSGRTLTTSRATLVQGGTTRLEVLAAMGDLGEPGGAPTMTLAPPDIPPPDQCVGRDGKAQGVFLPIMKRLDIRLNPSQAKSVAGGRAQVSGWIRFLDDRPVDTMALALFTDAFPPSVFGRLGMVGWVPTIELTIHVRRRPAPGWILGQFSTLDLADGRMIEDGALWDSTGALVAQSRQLGLVRTAG